MLSLVFVNIELTLKCNLHCLHCGSTAGKSRLQELTSDEWISVIQQLAALGCREVCVLGGEPLLVPDWLKIIQAIGNLGMDVVMITNGWHIDSEKVKQLKSIPRLDRIGVSLDGATAKIHDYIRGRKGSFQRALDALWMLRDADFEVGAITSVSRLNLSELIKIRDLLVGQDITWQLQTVAGHGHRWSKEWNITPEQHYQIAEFISKSRGTYGVGALPIAGSHCFGYFSERLKNYTELSVWPGCAAGLATLGICSSGEVKPCLSQPDSRIIGHLRKEPLKTIWQDNARFRRTRYFHMGMLGGFCHICPHAGKCRGGCPNLPTALLGSDKDNPFCCYRLEKEGRVPPDPLEKGWVE